MRYTINRMGRRNKQVLFGTTNSAKIRHVRAYLEALPVEVLSPGDLNIDIVVEEDGRTPEENAEKKARAYYAAAKMPTFAIDAGLRIEKFPEESQPGVYVRRISGGPGASDAALLDYYRKSLDEVGGTSPAVWYIAVSFVASADRVGTQHFTLQAVMTSQPSHIVHRDAPLSSLMLDPATGRYYSEMAYRERPDSVLITEILSRHLEGL
ncbi:MAG: hypothetical protein JXA21_24855 [Anaerolineae bacterium]|nr:hypothetical protein [Anaerolineae bacterium]